MTKISQQKIIFFILMITTMSLCSIVNIRLQSDTISLGGETEYIISLKVPKGAQINPPDENKDFGDVSVNDWLITPYEQGMVDSIDYIYKISAYEVKQCTIPSLRFIQTYKEKIDTFRTSEVVISVNSLLAKLGKDSATLRDSLTFETAGKKTSYLWIILAAVGFLLIIILIVYLIQKKKRATPPPLIIVPPFEEAQKALQLLESKNMIDRGEVREFTFELSDILKRYIERSYKVNAQEFTTEEILAWIKISPFDMTLKDLLRRFFEKTHFIKFAKAVPELQEVRTLIDDVKHFLHKTRPLGEEKKTGKENTTKRNKRSGAKGNKKKSLEKKIHEKENKGEVQ